MSEQAKPVALTVKEKIGQLNKFMSAPSIMAQFENSLKENSGAFVASLIDLFNGDKYLQECDPKAVVFEALKAASLKLPINKSLGFAWIIAYKGVATFQMGYKGYIQLALRTGFYKFLNCDEVYEGELQSKNKLTGEFDFEGEKTSDVVIGYFAHFELTNGFKKTLYMTSAQMKAWGAKYSPSFNQASSPWKKEFPKMALKTMIRNLLSHWGYLSIEMATAFDNDNDYKETPSEKAKTEAGENTGTEDIDFKEVKKESKQEYQEEQEEAALTEAEKRAIEEAEANQPNEKPNKNPTAGIQPNLGFDDKDVVSRDKPNFQ